MSNVPGHSLAKVCERSTAAASLIAGTDLGLFPHAPPPPSILHSSSLLLVFNGKNTAFFKPSALRCYGEKPPKRILGFRETKVFMDAVWFC